MNNKPSINVDPDKIRLAVKEYSNEKSLREIGKLIGVSAPTVAKLLRKEGVEIRPRYSFKENKPRQVPGVIGLSPEIQIQKEHEQRVAKVLGSKEGSKQQEKVQSERPKIVEV